MEVHPAVHYSSEVLYNMQEHDRNPLVSERQAYNQRRHMAHASRDKDRSDLSTITNGTSLPPPPQQTPSNPPTRTIMGGRNDIASLHSCNNN